MNLLVFDIDGTILNSTAVDDHCYTEALKASHGIVIDDFDWEDFKDVTDLGVTQDVLKKTFKREPTHSELLQVELHMGEMVWEERTENPEKFTPASGIENLLKELLAQKEIGFCLATGAWKDSAEAKLSALNVDLKNVPWQNSSFFRRRAQIVESAIQKSREHYGVNKFNQACALGDGQWDYLTALELDLNFIGVDLNHTGRIREHGASKVINGYKSLNELVSLAFL